MERRCAQNQGQRDATKSHLEKAAEQEKKIDQAFFTSGWAERAVWLMVVAILGFLAMR